MVYHIHDSITCYNPGTKLSSIYSGEDTQQKGGSIHPCVTYFDFGNQYLINTDPILTQDYWYPSQWNVMENL